jgi:DNA-binding transcriptional ArsR family regulator
MLDPVAIAASVTNHHPDPITTIYREIAKGKLIMVEDALTAENSTCKLLLTGEMPERSSALTSEELLAALTALAHPLRLRIIAELAGGRVHVSELARRLDMSRPLLYMHLDRLEKAGMVSGKLELSADGKAMKYYELAPFELLITAETVIAALRADEEDKDE